MEYKTYSLLLVADVSEKFAIEISLGERGWINLFLLDFLESLEVEVCQEREVGKRNNYLLLSLRDS